MSGSHPGRDAKGVASSPRAEIRRFLDRLAVLDDPRLAEVDVATARAVMVENCREFWGDVEPVDRIEDHRIVVGDRILVVRGYRPTLEQRPPALVFFHGGGWVVGGIETHDGLCRRLANAAQCAVFSVAYRLAPEHPFPAAVDDSVSALAWVHGHASELQIDPACLSVAGDSAGGNLAAVAARRVARAGVRLASQVLVYPVTGGRTDTPSYDANAEGYFLSREDMEWFFSHYARSLPDLEHPDLAPIQADDLSGLAPAYIATCEFDPLRDEGNLYADRLDAAGVPVTIEEWRGMIHGFILMRTVTSAADELFDRIVGFLRASWVASRANPALTAGSLTSLGAPDA